MSNLMDVLHAYAQDHEIEVMLRQDDSYMEGVRCIQKQETRLRALLDEALEGILDEFLSEQQLLQLKKEEVHFWAGFRMAVELTR